ncbi:unnamed protein product [Closterium sp. NIES-54]
MAQALYNDVVARYSSSATAALGRQLLPYLFPELSAFATVEDLVSHLRASNARYRAAVLAEFLDRNPPLMFITLYFIVTRLLDSLRSVRDHNLSLDPTSLTVDLLEQHLLAAETSAVAVGAARGTPRPSFLKGCSPSPLAPSYASAAAADVSVAEDVGAASASAKCRSSKGKGGKGGGGGSGGGGGGSGSSGGGSSRGGGRSANGGGSGGSGSGGGGSSGSGGSGGGGTGGGGTGARRTCGRPHTQHRCISRLDDAWRAEFGDDVELARGTNLLRSRIAIFDLDFDAILSAMYALSNSPEGDCYWCVPPDPSIAAAALDASESGTLPGTTPAQALHTFTLDSDASACLHLLLFSANLVSTAALQDAMVTTTTLGGQRVTNCTCTRTGHHLATFTLRPGSSLYTLATEPPQVAASAQVSASGQVAASCLCRLLSHQTLLWHHRLCHPSMTRLRGKHSRLLVSGLPGSLPPSPAPPCLPCVEGRQRAAPHSSSFPPTSAPLQTLHMDVWGPARISGQDRERYFLLVVDNYTRYTTVFPLRSKGQVVDVLIPWIRTVRLQLREWFGQDLPVLCLHSDKGGEFSSNLLQDFCRGEGILQSFMLPDSPQQNGIAERRIGLVMEVARTSMIHAAAPHFLWLFADVTFDESVLFYRLFPYRSAPPPPPPLFLAPSPPSIDPLPPKGPAPSRVSQVDPLPGPVPVHMAVGSGAARGAASGGAASGGAEPGSAESEGAETGGAEPGGVEIGGGEPGGAEPEGVEPGGAALEGGESGGAEPQGAVSSGSSATASQRLSPQHLREWFVRRASLRSGATGAGGVGAAGAGGAGVAAGVGVTGGTAATGPGGAFTWGTGGGDPAESGATGAGGSSAGGAGAGDPAESGATDAGGSCAGGAGAGGAGFGGTGAGGAGVGGTGTRGAGAGGAEAVDPGGAVRPRQYFVLVLQQSKPPLQPASPLPAPSPYTDQSGALTERRESASRPVLPVCIAHCIPRSRPPPVPDTHAMTLRTSSVPLCSHCLSSPRHCCHWSAAASALIAEQLDFAATCHLDYTTTLIAENASTSPLSVGGECALFMDVLKDRQEEFEFLAAAVPRFASMLLAPEGDPDASDIPTPRSYVEAITGPYSSQWQAAMDAKMASWKSTGTYVDEVPPLGVNIVDGMWIFRVKRPPGSPPAFKARYIARGFSQRRGVDYFHTFSPTSKMTTLRVLLHVAAQRDYQLHSLDFSTAFLQGSLHEEIRLCGPPCFTGTTLAALGFAPSTADPLLFLHTNISLPPFYVLVYVDDLVFATADTEALTLVKSELQKRHTCIDLGEVRSYLGLHITRDRARRTITLTQSHMVHQGPVVLTSHAYASWVDDSATQRSSQGYTFSLGSGSVSWRSTRSSSVLSFSCEAEIYAGAMAAEELRWLTYLLTDLGEQPRSPPVLYVDNKAMISLCQEHKLEHRTKHIALRYFLARELQQRGQLRLAYVATRANTADIFTKALPPGDHQRFFTVLGLVPTLPHLLSA